MKCPNCGLENPNTALRCDCGYGFLNKLTVDANHVSASTLDVSRTIEDQGFSTLLLVGKVVAFLGWTFSLIAIVVSLIMFGSSGEISSFLIGIAGIAYGIITVAYGQTILCFVSIEKGVQSIIRELKTFNITK